MEERFSIVPSDGVYYVVRNCDGQIAGHCTTPEDAKRDKDWCEINHS